MSEFELTLRPRRDVEEPLHLDVWRQPPARLRPAPTSGGVMADSFHLDLAVRRPGRGKRGGGRLVLACALMFLLAAGAGVMLLKSPSDLRDRLTAAIATLVGDGGGEPEARAEPIPEPTAPATDAAQTPTITAAPLETALPPTSATISADAASPVVEAPPAPEPVAAPPAKPPAVSAKHRSSHTIAARKPSATAKKVQAHRPTEASLDLDALAKSLH